MLEAKFFVRSEVIAAVDVPLPAVSDALKVKRVAVVVAELLFVRKSGVPVPLAGATLLTTSNMAPGVVVPIPTSPLLLTNSPLEPPATKPPQKVEVAELEVAVMFPTLGLEVEIICPEASVVSSPEEGYFWKVTVLEARIVPKYGEEEATNTPVEES